MDGRGLQIGTFIQSVNYDQLSVCICSTPELFVV